MRKYFKIWLKWAQCTFATVWEANRLSSFLFLLGKLIRFFFFLLFLIIFVGKTKALAGYTFPQAIFFFLVFNLIDILSQFLFRGIYWLRGKIISGQFDYILLRPINPLFEVLLSHPDPLDLITLIFLIGFLIYFILKNTLIANLLSAFLFFLLIVNALILALSLHIIAASFGLMTLEVDHIIWIYRDIFNMGRIPTDLYAPILKSFLTFVIPVGIMVTIPAKVLMGFLSWQEVLFSFLISSLFLSVSLSFWKFALTFYTSASS